MVNGAKSKKSLYAQSVARTAVAVAPEPPPPENEIVGAEEYPLPGLVIVILATASPDITAVPVAVTPPAGAALNVTVGAEV